MTVDPDIKLTLTFGRQFKGSALFVSEERVVQGNDTIEAKFKIPHGVEPMNVAWILVHVSES